MSTIKPIHEIIEEILGKGPENSHKLTYDSGTETLEPIYFFILDLMNDLDLGAEKIVDNFISSPGSGHFAEIGQRASIMQQQGSKILGDVNTVLRSVLNLIYDLKEFRIRLKAYEDLKSSDTEVSMAARLSLKQIWLDKVDIGKGNSSIKAMTFGQAGYQTLLDAFLVAHDEKDAQKIDLNDRVKRIVASRVSEFNIWLEHSEKELSKRYELEKNYLRSQVNSLKLYTRWVRPYLIAASRLESQNPERNPNLVNIFNTLVLELTLLGKSKIKVKESALGGDLPPEFAKESFLKTLKKDYYSVVLIDFNFRGIPQRVAQQSHFSFGGKAEITFRAYAMSKDELAKFDKQMDDSDLTDALNLIEGTTEGSLKQVQEEIDFFLEDKDTYEAEAKKPKDKSNPFAALLGFYDEKPKESKPKKEKEKEIIINKDNWVEKNYIRKFAVAGAKEIMAKIFETYKKAHGMPSFPWRV